MPLSRRQFCSIVGAAGLSTFGDLLHKPSAWAAEQKQDHLRVIAYNVYKCRGWPQDRPLAKRAVAREQMAARLALELALYEPDIVTFSESPEEKLTKEIARRPGLNHIRFPSGGSWPGTLLSRFEIIESNNAPVVSGKRLEDLFTRHWGRGTVKLPNGENLVVHSAHLHPSKSDIRQREIAEMLKEMRGDLKAGRSMLLMGDLNHAPTPPEYPMWADAGWMDTFAKVGKGKGLTIKADEPTRLRHGGWAIAKRVTESRPLFEGGSDRTTTIRSPSP